MVVTRDHVQAALGRVDGITAEEHAQQAEEDRMTLDDAFTKLGIENGEELADQFADDLGPYAASFGSGFVAGLSIGKDGLPEVTVVEATYDETTFADEAEVQEEVTDADGSQA